MKFDQLAAYCDSRCGLTLESAAMEFHDLAKRVGFDETEAVFVVHDDTGAEPVIYAITDKDMSFKCSVDSGGLDRWEVKLGDKYFPFSF
jgi:hypothetical protein